MTLSSTLLESLVDYAGLFPPSALDMEAAVANYAAYRGTSERGVLASFVVPAGRLDAFEKAASSFLPGDGEAAPAWSLSVLLGPDRAADLETARAFGERHRAGLGQGRARVAAYEVKPTGHDEIAPLSRQVGPGVELFFEIPWTEDPGPWVEAVGAVGARAKIRTGGVEPSAIPPTPAVARFLRACAAHDVPFKATAGLHHPVRGEHPLTYEAVSVRATMHGFLNVFTAGALLATQEVGDAELLSLLEETQTAAFELGPEGLRWRDRFLPAGAIRASRREFARSFGSCSFTEPIDDLKNAELS